MKKQALFATLTDKHAEKKLIIVRGLDKLSIKTKKLNQILTDLKLTEKGHKPNKILLASDKYNKNIYLSGRNIENLTVREAQLLNPYDILAHSHLLMMEEAVEALKSVYFKKKTSTTVKTPEIKKVVKKSKSVPIKKVRKTIKKKV